MTDIAHDIREQIKQVVKDGDLARLKSLASQFPDSFESFREAKNDNLVEIAWKNRRDDISIFLIIEHGFEVTPLLKTEEGFDIYPFDDEQEKFHKTMEVLGASIVSAKQACGENCRTIEHWMTTNFNPLVFEKMGLGLNPQFVHQTMNGNLAKFAHEKTEDPRPHSIETAHSSAMLFALNKNAQKLQQQFMEQQTAESADKSRDPRDRGRAIP